MNSLSSRRGSAFSAVILALSLLLPVVASGPVSARRSNGAVSARSVDQLYLDKGTASGLTEGASVLLYRQRRRAGKCTVSAASAHHATCFSAGLTDIDRFSFVAVKSDPLPPPTKLPTLGPKAQSHGRSVLSTQAFTKVALRQRAQRRHSTSTTLRSGLQHRSFVSLSSGGAGGERGFHSERLSVAAGKRDALVAGLNTRARVDLTGALVGVDRSRFRPGDSVRLDVFELALQYRPIDSHLTAQAGRLVPQHIIGIRSLDGVTAGFRFANKKARTDLFEAGVYGGTVADSLTLHPSLSRYSGGAYLVANILLGTLHLRHLSRLGVRLNTNLDLRAELEGLVDARLGHLGSIAVGTRLAYDAKAPSQPFVDLFHASVHLRPWERFIVRGGYRYAGRVRP